MTLLKGFVKSSTDPETRELRELMLDDFGAQNNTPSSDEAMR